MDEEKQHIGIAITDKQLEAFRAIYKNPLMTKQTAAYKVNAALQHKATTKDEDINQTETLK